MGGMNAQFTGSSALAGRRPSRAVLSLLAVFVAVCFLLGFMLAVLSMPVARAQSGDLTVDIIAGYNLVVDSNAGSPSTFAPSVATVVGRFCNIGASTLTGVQGYIGDYDGGVSPKPGIYPARDSSTFATDHPLYNTGWYTFTHLGGALGTADATRFVGALAPGECKVQYWHFTYPQCTNVGGVPEAPPCSGNPVWGDSVKPEDDLWLQFDIWGEAPGGHSDDKRWTMTMRNEISAMANKIEPNPDGQWFNTNSDAVRPGDVITSNGILYNLGNVRHGFDNDGDYAPDYNAWMQPVGDAAYDPSCFRLIRSHGVLTVSRGAGKPDLIIEFKDWEDPHPVYGGPLYFTNLPEDNNGVIGNIYYTFLALDGPCFTGLSPYQEVASGYDNEKFNGDYGGAMPPNVGSTPPEVAVDKQGNVTVTPGSRMTYTVGIDNTGASDAGLPLYSMPLVVSDTIPANTTYAGAEASVGVDYRYLLTDGTYTTTLPADLGTVEAVQWWLTDTLAAGASGVLTLSVDVAGGASGVIENCAETSFGGGAAFGEDCTTTLIEGTYSIGDFVWRDLDNDTVQDGGSETGIDGVTVWLYYDVDGDGVLDTDVDLLVDSTDTAGGGIYSFSSLSAGDYLVKVHTSDPQIPEGYRITSHEVVAVALSGATSPYLDADFGFGPSLRVTKTLIDGYGYQDRDVSYNIAVRNLRPGGGETVAAGCRYETWATSGSTANPPKDFTNASSTYGEPDGNYAYGDFSIGSNRWIKGTGYDLIGNGTITKMEAIIPFYLGASLTDDQVTLRLFNGGTELGAARVFTTAYLNASYVGAENAHYLVWDITDTSYSPDGSWSWDDLALLTLHLEPTKVGGADDNVIYLDALGLRVTGDESCAVLDVDDVLVAVPLTDTYDTNLLQYVSASPAPSSVDTVNGVITWTNIGPIYPGQTQVVQVAFLGLAPGSPSVANNTACSTDTEFSDGLDANDDCDTASGYISPTGYISGVVWSDVDTDGWAVADGYESGEPRIPGVVLTLYQCTSQDGSWTVPPSPSNPCGHSSNQGVWSEVDTQVTDSTGHYAFEGLAEGYYYVAVDTDSIIGSGSPTEDADDASNPYYPCTDGNDCQNDDDMWADPGANLDEVPKLMPYGGGALEAITNTNFGYSVSAALFGTVWEDVDGDGIRESGEEGIAGVVITLTNGSALTTTTDATGAYTFTGLTGGTTYTLTVDTDTLPPGGSWTQTDDPDAALDDEHTVTISTGEISGSHDFGYHRHSGPYSIGDTVYADWNGDGDQDAGEEGLSGITVTLYTNAGAYITETVTSGTGYYIFTGLVTGTYRVVVDTDGMPPAWDDYEATQDPDETGVCTTCDSQGSSTVSSTLTSDTTVDFGYRPKGFGSIGDYVWLDEDGDGVQGPDETGLANITVTLYEDNGNSTYEPGTDALIATATTGADGDYLFEYLAAGYYLVIVDTIDSDLPTDGYGAFYYLTTGNDPHPVTLATAQNYLDADFGFTAPGAIGDYVWQDNNGDGVQDAGEPGIANVAVQLWIDTDGNGTPDVLSATTTTDASGIYSFTGVVSGTYVVVVDETSAALSGFSQTGDPDLTTACSGVGCDARSALSLRAGQIDMSRDFGYQPPGVIGDYVWFDMNGDGVTTTAEAPIAGVVLTLTPSSGPAITTTTDADGYYSSGNLSDGAYTVTVDTSTLPPSVTQNTYDWDDGLSSPDGEAVVTIAAGGSNMDIDFGYRYSGSETITGHVFFDSGDDGGTYIGSVDTPYGGITVYLINSSGRQIAQTSTDATGAFTFTNLAGGGITYTVSVNRNSAQLAGTTMTATPSEPGVRCTTCNGYNTVTASASNQDFGFYAAMDFGDLPDTYSLTKLADEGAYHISGTLRLGSGISAEADGQESTTAISDTLDDGVVRNAADLWQPGNTVRIDVTVTGGTGYLIGWFDWNGDNDFSDANEMIRFGSLSAGVHTLNITIPSGYATGNTLNARFRLYDGQPTAISPLGATSNGEVEDYQWEFGINAVTIQGLDAKPRMVLGAVVLLLILGAVGLGAPLLSRQFARRRVRS
jgi:uncharacterized repeat protein (TIGR01451 family)